MPWVQHEHLYHVNDEIQHGGLCSPISKLAVAAVIFWISTPCRRLKYGSWNGFIGKVWVNQALPPCLIGLRVTRWVQAFFSDPQCSACAQDFRWGINLQFFNNNKSTNKQRAQSNNTSYYRLLLSGPAVGSWLMESGWILTVDHGGSFSYILFQRRDWS